MRAGAKARRAQARRKYDRKQGPSHGANRLRCSVAARRRAACRRYGSAGWARPGTACQLACPAQLQANLAPKLALPAAAGMRRDLAPPRRLDPGHGPGHVARVIDVQFRST
jgi:hypothetical protein